MYHQPRHSAFLGLPRTACILKLRESTRLYANAGPSILARGCAIEEDTKKHQRDLELCYPKHSAVREYSINQRHSGISEPAPPRIRTNEEAIEISLHKNLSREWGYQWNKIIQTLKHRRGLTTILFHKPRVSARSSCNFVRGLASPKRTPPFRPLSLVQYTIPHFPFCPFPSQCTLDHRRYCWPHSAPLGPQQQLCSIMHMGDRVGTPFGVVFFFVHHVVLKRVVFVPGRTQPTAFSSGVCWLKAYI
jgi:hypothetical protein